MAQTLTDVFNIRVQFPIDLRTVKSDINARNAIEPLQRYEGLPVWVVSEQKLYRLIGGITNDDWVDQTPNGGIQTVTVSSSTPTGGNPGDIHFKTVSGGFEVWFNNLGTWGSVGTVPTGSSGPTRTPDPSLNFATTSADMESSHPTAAIGDIFYNVDGTEIYVATKMANGVWQIQQSGT